MLVRSFQLFPIKCVTRITFRFDEVIILIGVLREHISIGIVLVIGLACKFLAIGVICIFNYKTTIILRLNEIMFAMRKKLC